MAWTQAQLDALDAALASGVLTVEYAGKRTTYRNFAEMRDLRAMIAGAIGREAGTPRMRSVRFVGEKGL